MDAYADETSYAAGPSEPAAQQNTPVGSRKRKRSEPKDSDLSDLPSPDSPLIRPKRKARNSLVSPATPKDTPSGTISPLTKHVAGPPKPLTARQRVVQELLQTERNYVEILTNILKVFKEPLEKESIISAVDIKTIFGWLPGVKEVHTNILTDLEVLVNEWKEDKCIGDIISYHAEELVKVYPSFISYIDIIKKTVERCDEESPKFHDFLEVCGRKSLAELLKTPVQRLFSMNSHISALLEKTDKTNPDHKALGQAVDSLKKVLTHMDEDKGIKDGYAKMFQIVGDVDGCPADVLSAHRVYVTKADTIELSDTICGKGKPVTIFLFSDSMEVTKRRDLPMKMPATFTPQKMPYEHVKFIPFSDFKQVVDIRDNDYCQNSFGIIYHCPQEKQHKLMMFILANNEISKREWLQKLTTGLANTACMANTETFLKTMDPQHLNLTKSDIPCRLRSPAVRKLELEGEL